MFRIPFFLHTVNKTGRCLAHAYSEFGKNVNRQQKPSLTTPISKILPNAAAQTESEFLVNLKSDPDTFGDATKEEIYEKDLEEDRHYEQQTLPSKKLRTKQYAELIKAHIRKHKIKEAIDVLEIKMLKEDQVKPESYIYNLLLGACGRVGYTKKAFSLYNQMKKRGFKAMGGTYTALFNACANSPWPEDGLTRAKHLRNIMMEKMYEPNVSNYNAMIKAFGRCGDLPTAFSIVDEMASKKIPIKDHTMNFLLQACIQDKEAGFRHVLLVWRKMVQKNIAPSLFTYNLILRSIRDCGIGDIEVMEDVLKTILRCDPLRIKAQDKLLLGNSNIKLIQGSSEPYGDVGPNMVETKPNELEKPINIDSCRPNLMARTPQLGNIISLNEITKVEDRLLLVGGFKGFLSNMEENNCSPDVKTFTQLLDCMPGNLASEQDLFKIMEKYNVEPDIGFFNVLIKKRSMRFDYENAKAVVQEMSRFGYRPDLITFGVLSLGCKTKEEALELLNEMGEHSYRINAEILGAMLQQACRHHNFSYVLEIMEIALKEQIKPNKQFMECLETFKKICKHISNNKEHKLYESAKFQKGFRIFQMRYKTWLNEVEVDNTEDEHPWSQYRTTNDNDARHYKEKSTRFRPKHLSKFKVKTSTKRRY